MARYQLLPVGVLDTSTGQRLIPQSGSLWEAYLAWRLAGNDPDPYVPPATPAETLDEAKARRRWQIKRDGLERIQTRLPAIDAFDTLALVRELYLSIAPAARQPTVDWQWLIDTYQAGQAALNSVGSAATIAQVNAVTPNWPA